MRTHIHTYIHFPDIKRKELLIHNYRMEKPWKYKVKMQKNKYCTIQLYKIATTYKINSWKPKNKVKVTESF